MSLGGGIPNSVIRRGYTSHYYLEEVHVVTVLCGGVHFTVLSPPRVRLLVPAVFQSFLVSSFCLPALSPIFHFKNSFHDTPVFSSLLATDFCPTGHSSVFVCITARFYMALLLLSVVAFRPSVFAVRCAPRRGRMGSWGSNTLPRPGLLDGWLGWPDPVNRLAMLCPNFD